MKLLFTSANQAEVSRKFSLREQSLTILAATLVVALVVSIVYAPSPLARSWYPWRNSQPAAQRQWWTYASQAMRQGHPDQAIYAWNQLLQMDLSPDNKTHAYYGRGVTYAQMGDFDKAIGDMTQAIGLSPNDEWSHYYRGWAFGQKGDLAKAIADYRDAARLAPHSDLFNNDLAWVLATCPTDSLRNGKEAEALARKACELTHWKKWQCLGTLAAACAELGDFELAVQYQKQALSLANLPEKDRAEESQRLSSYERHQPWREAVKPLQSPRHEG